MRNFVAEKLKLALFSPSFLLQEAAEGQHAPGPQPPPLPLRQRLPVDQDDGLGADVRDVKHRARPHPLRALGSAELFDFLRVKLSLRRGGLLLLDGELHAPDAEEAREGDVVGGAPGVGDGDKVLGAERGWVFYWVFLLVVEGEKKGVREEEKKETREKLSERA